jgi:hypothetical protein
VPTDSHTCVLVGHTQTPEMRPVEALLRALFPEPNLRRIERISAARAADLAADLIVVCQTWSDEYTAGEVTVLVSAAPLARILCVYGRWCDSDGRTRDIWPLAVRVPVAEFETRLWCELEVLDGMRPPLPLTASRTEIFAARLPPAVTMHGGRTTSNACSNQGP